MKIISWFDEENGKIIEKEFKSDSDLDDLSTPGDMFYKSA